MIVRKMVKEDIPYVGDIELECFGKRDIDNLTKCLQSSNYHYFVAEEYGIVGGYVSLLKIDENAELIAIAVERNKQHKGIATTMLAYVLDFAKSIGAQAIFLEVNVNNSTARKLYDKFNFVPISIRKKYYKGKEDAVILKRVL